MVVGYINSVETCGTVDGPGIRYILFLQGCPMRCKYCHNRDTWDKNNYKISKTADEVIEDALRYESFIRKGGITISGGEPLLQADFCLEVFKKIKEYGIHRCLDTAGTILNDTVKELLEYTDLVLLDIKSINKEVHRELTSFELEPVLKFLEYLNSIDKKIWVRHVVVPDLTDNREDLRNLANYLKNYRNIIEKVELLSYHNVGEIKWNQMGVDYQLKNTRVFKKEEFEEIKRWFSEVYNR